MDDPGGGDSLDCGWGIRAMVDQVSGGWDGMGRLSAESPACDTVSALVVRRGLELGGGNRRVWKRSCRYASEGPRSGRGWRDAGL